VYSSFEGSEYGRRVPSHPSSFYYVCPSICASPSNLQLQWMEVQASGLQDVLSATVDYEGICGAHRDGSLAPGAAHDATFKASGDADTPGVPFFVRLTGLRVGLASYVQVRQYGRPEVYHKTLLSSNFFLFFFLWSWETPAPE